MRWMVVVGTGMVEADVPAGATAAGAFVTQLVTDWPITLLKAEPATDPAKIQI